MLQKCKGRLQLLSPVFLTLFSSSPLFFPCMLCTTLAKAMELQSLVLHEFELPKSLPWTIYSSPSFLNCFAEHKAIKKHQNLTQLLETIARVPNMLIELKGNNYYSKVLKRANYKLQNSMFWVVIKSIPWSFRFTREASHAKIKLRSLESFPRIRELTYT